MERVSISAQGPPKIDGKREYLELRGKGKRQMLKKLVEQPASTDEYIVELLPAVMKIKLLFKTKSMAKIFTSRTRPRRIKTLIFVLKPPRKQDFVLGDNITEFQAEICPVIYIISYHIISYHISEIYSASISKRT